MNRRLRPLLLVAIFLVILSVTIAQPAFMTQAVSYQIARSLPTPPKTSRVKGSRGALVTRGKKSPCPDLKGLPDLTAIVPEFPDPTPKTNEKLVWSQTTVDRPTFWIYIPYTEKVKVTFGLLTEQGAAHFPEIPVTLPTKSGLVRVQIPASAAPLVRGQLYQWFLNVECKGEFTSASGWVERMPLAQTVSQQIKNASVLEKAKLYAEQNAWHDSIATLAEEYDRNPSDPAARSQWQTLLQTLKLTDEALKTATPVK